MIVVDSSVWIARLRGLESEAVRTFAAVPSFDAIVVGDIILLEVLQGARDDRHASRLEAELREFRIARMLDHDLAVTAARNYRRLRARGVTVRRAPDLIIATFCVENGYALLQQDRDFTRMADELGLRLI